MKARSISDSGLYQKSRRFDVYKGILANSTTAEPHMKALGGAGHVLILRDGFV